MVEVLYSLECMVVRLFCFSVTFAFGVCNEHCSVCVCVCVCSNERAYRTLVTTCLLHTHSSVYSVYLCICVFAFLRFFCFAFCVREYMPTGPSV